jgi:hypothetical protein
MNTFPTKEKLASNVSTMDLDIKLDLEPSVESEMEEIKVANVEYNSFPEDINLAHTLKVIENKQFELTKSTRKVFTKLIRESRDTCRGKVCLIFPDGLHLDNRYSIAKELLERFSKIQTIWDSKNPNAKAKSTNVICNLESLPRKITAIQINFLLEGLSLRKN